MAFQTFEAKRLAQAAITATAATIYTVPAATRTMVKSIIIANTTGSAKNVTLNIVPFGGTGSAANQIIPAVALSGNTVFQLDTTQVMHEGDFIRVLASATGCTVTISGAEAT